MKLSEIKIYGGGTIGEIELDTAPAETLREKLTAQSKKSGKSAGRIDYEVSKVLLAAAARALQATAFDLVAPDGNEWKKAELQRQRDKLDAQIAKLDAAQN